MLRHDDAKPVTAAVENEGDFASKPLFPFAY